MRYAAFLLCAGLVPVAPAQTLRPSSITSVGGPTCSGSAETYEVSIELPQSSTSNRIDVFLLFDDTTSFENQVPAVVQVFTRVVALLQAQVPTADIAYGVGRFEDYGGPGSSYSGELPTGRPFILNQAILSRSNPGFVEALQGALMRSAPGFGGDLPETSAGEALFQIATGAGFDGDGDGTALGSGPSGLEATQVTPGTSGDVPPFSGYVGLTSGEFGGVGWRRDSLRIVILATEVCSVSPFDASMPIPTHIVGTGSVEPVTAFACPPTTLGGPRFGFVGDAPDAASNTVAGAVAPAGAATIPMSVAALNAAGIRVVGLAPGGHPTSDPGPSLDASVMLSAMARLTGAVDAAGEPLVFDTTAGLTQVAQGIVDSVLDLAVRPLDLALVPDGLPAGLTASVTPALIPGVGPGTEARFSVTLVPDPAFAGGAFELDFRDATSGAVSGSIPVLLQCAGSCVVLDFETEDDLTSPLVNGQRVESPATFGTRVEIRGTSASGFGAAVFDTDPQGPNAASSDPDLLVGTGNALILQENGLETQAGIYDLPDDDANGGRFTIDFVRPSLLCSIDLIDFDLIDTEEARLVLRDDSGRSRTYLVPPGFTEDVHAMTGTGVRTLDLTEVLPQQGFLSTATATEAVGFDPARVVRLVIDLAGSGALDNLAFVQESALRGQPGALAQGTIRRR